MNNALTPQEVLQRAAANAGHKVTISFSGAEDVVLIDMASKLGLPFDVFSLDTGRLHDETLAFLDQVEAHYGISIDRVRPDAARVQELVDAKGLFSFYEDGHKECCGIRKTEPLRAHLTGYDAWITGQRQDQSPTRADVPQVQIDTAFAGRSGHLDKYNPLAHWSSDEVWQYIRSEGVPYNALHDRNYKSIGCEPCTRAIKPGEHERAGRWWWEESTQKECGLHIINMDEDDGAVSPIPTQAAG